MIDGCDTLICYVN